LCPASISWFSWRRGKLEAACEKRDAQEVLAVTVHPSFKGDRTMRRIAAVSVALLAGLAQAQAPATAPATKSGDPIVQSRMQQRDANATYNATVAEARKQRDAKINAAGEAAVKDAKASGKDPLVARRDARSKARRESQADFDAAVAAARKERDAARAQAAATRKQ
jgi:hypothetical protein